MLAVFGLAGPWEWIIVLVVVLIFFGAGKLPQVLGQMGKGVKAFKEGMNEKDVIEGMLSENTTASETAKEKVTDVQEV